MDLKESIKKLANQCVKCGVCAPHCPTYVKTLNEGESARGRIALMDAVANNQLPLNDAVLNHLDSCLNCRSCEAVCPSTVSYGELLNKTHQLIGQKRPMPMLLNFLFRSPDRLKIIVFFLKCYQLSGIQWIARKTKLLHLLHLTDWDNLLPKLTLRPTSNFVSKTKNNKPSLTPIPTVFLFTGCISSFTQAHTIKAAITLLTTYGFKVNYPSQLSCCGALHLQNGAPEYHSLAEKNIQTSSSLPTLFLDTGCGMILKEYPQTVTPSATVSQQKIETFSQTLFDIPHFLVQHVPENQFHFHALPITIALHTPCSQKNKFKTEDSLLFLLHRIPHLTIILLNPPLRCCGAAGLSMLTHSEMAETLADDILKEIEKIKPDFIITSNIGCRLHLEAQLKKRKKKIPLLHPVELLLMALPPSN